MSRALRLAGDLELQAMQAKLRRAPTQPPVVGEANGGAPRFSPQPRNNARDGAKTLERATLERDVLSAVFAAIKYHPKVAFAWRQNTGAAVRDERVVRFAFAGCSDILGMLKDGRFLAIECKRPGGKLSTGQHVFLHKVNRHGGLGFMATCVTDVARALDGAA